MDAVSIVLDVDGVSAITRLHADVFARVDDELDRLLRTVHALSCTLDTPAAHYAADSSAQRVHCICDRLSECCKR